MKIWVDDIRPAPEGWYQARSVNVAKEMIMGNWDVEKQQIIEESEMFAQLADNSDFAGALGGRFTSRQNNAANITNPEDGDDGTRDRRRRNDARRVDTTIEWIKYHQKKKIYSICLKSRLKCLNVDINS